VAAGILRMKRKRKKRKRKKGNDKIIQILILFSKKRKIKKSKRVYKNRKRSNVDESYGRDNR